MQNLAAAIDASAPGSENGKKGGIGFMHDTRRGNSVYGRIRFKEEGGERE